MPSRVSLTIDLVVSNLKSPGRNLTDYRDKDHKGFYIRVRAGGIRRWFYRYRISNKVYRYWLGRYPKVTCGEAFSRYLELFESVEDGKNPVLDEQRAKDLEATKQAEADTKLTLAVLFDDHYLPKYAKVRKRSWAHDDYMFTRHLRQPLGNEKAEDIDRRAITAIVKALEDSGKVTTARQVLALIRKVYNWATSDGVELVDCANPATYKIQSKAKADDLILSDDEIKKLWPALGESNADRAIGLLLLTGSRPAEVARMHRSEIDTTAAEWILPAARMKNKRPHVVPLSDAMLALIKDGQGFIFATYGRHGAMHPTTINHRLADLCKKLKISAARPKTLRKTVNSQLAKLGIPLEVRQRVLSHTPQDVNSVHYNMHDYLPEKRRALDAWESRLIIITGNTK